MKIKWSIRSLKHMPDGSWDALLVADRGKNSNGRQFDRLFSDDGFHWETRYRTPAREDVQDMLTQAMGSMLDEGIFFVVF